MYALIYTKLFQEVWAIDPAAHRALQEAFLHHLAGKGHHEAAMRPNRGSGGEEQGPLPLATLVSSLGGTASSRNRYLATFGSTAIISAHGVLGKHLSGMEMACGGCSMDTLQNAMDIVASSPDIKKVILDANSPGGQVIGTQETAGMFRALAQEGKKTYAVTDSQMGSAMYWIASQAANGLYATPSAVVGSVGTYMAFTDTSEEMAKLGRKIEVIKSEGSDFKGMGAPGSSLSDEQRGFLQDRANLTNKAFKTDVTAQRPKIKEENLRGQFYSGPDAKQKGYIDSTIGSVTSLVRRLS
jgi:ClpP class serine protease